MIDKGAFALPLPDDLFDYEESVFWDARRRRLEAGPHRRDVHYRMDRGKAGHRELVITTAPTTFFQNHNLHGSDDAAGLGADLGAAVFAAVGEDLPPALEELWRRGEWPPYMAHLTRMVDVGSREAVPECIRELAHGHYPRVREKCMGTDARLARFKLNGHELLFYDKFREIQERRHELPDERLLEWSRPLLRVELKLSRDALKRNGLDAANRFNTASVISVIEKHLRRITLSEATPLQTETGKALPWKDRVMYAAWRHGEPIRDWVPADTLRKYRARLQKHGIDLWGEPQDESGAQSSATWVRDLLLVSPVWAEFPQWAVDAGLYYEPGP